MDKSCKGCVYHWFDGRCGVRADHPRTSKGCEDYQDYYHAGEIHDAKDAKIHDAIYSFHSPTMKDKHYVKKSSVKEIKKVLGYLIIFFIFASIFVFQVQMMHMPFLVVLGIYCAAFIVVALVILAATWIMG